MISKRTIWHLKTSVEPIMREQTTKLFNWDIDLNQWFSNCAPRSPRAYFNIHIIHIIVKPNMTNVNLFKFCFVSLRINRLIITFKGRKNIFVFRIFVKYLFVYSILVNNIFNNNVELGTGDDCFLK